MQEVVEARLVRYHDGRPDIQVLLDGEYTLLHRLLERRLRVVQFVPFLEAKWEHLQDEFVLFAVHGCAIIESIRDNT